MKITAEYKGKQVTFDVPDEKLDELVKDQMKKTGWEKPEVGQAYWLIGQLNSVDGSTWRNDVVDSKRFDCVNCFTSKELAENIARYQSLDRRIRRRIAEICEPNSRGKKQEWKIRYDYMRCNLHVDSNGVIRDAAWYCDTKEHAEQIINEFREELMWYFTEFKDRMDG